MVPAKTIPQRELRNNVAEVLRRIEAGETLVVTVSGRPVAELRPISGGKRLGTREDLVRILTEAPLDEDFERDINDLFDDEIEIR